jgi:hypothetical protein
MKNEPVKYVLCCAPDEQAGDDAYYVGENPCLHGGSFPSKKRHYRHKSASIQSALNIRVDSEELETKEFFIE